MIRYDATIIGHSRHKRIGMLIDFDALCLELQPAYVKSCIEAAYFKIDRLVKEHGVRIVRETWTEVK